MERIVIDEAIRIEGFQHSVVTEEEAEVQLAEQNQCAICHQNYEADTLVSRVPCGGRHLFHYGCITTALVRCIRSIN